MKRRTVLLGTVGVAAAAYGGSMTIGALRPCRPFEIDNPLFASAQRIGARLLASGFDPAPLDEGRLDQLHADLPERMRRDFAANDTVRCNGWILSRSEAEFCVHYARLSGADA